MHMQARKYAATVRTPSVDHTVWGKKDEKTGKVKIVLLATELEGTPFP